MLSQLEIRRKIKNKRSLLSRLEVENLSDKITKNTLTLDLIKHQTFFVYNSFNNEVDTLKIIEFLKANNKTVLYPLIIGDNMYAVKPLSDKFCLDKYGILVPKDYEIVNEVDVVIVPLIACDLSKNRIGFGKGYYDRFLAGKNAIKIGLSYDFQVLDDIPSNDWDIKLDLIVTESRIIK